MTQADTRNRWTVIDEGRAREMGAIATDQKLWLSAEALADALGWELRSEGLCRGDVCVPVPEGADLVSDRGVDLDGFAELLERPLVVDRDERVVSLGASARAQARALASGVAPDFTLPDLDGREHTLSHYRGKKVLLVTYASW